MIEINIKEIREKVLKIIDEYSNKGVVTPDSRNADYIIRINDFIDVAQREIMQYKFINGEKDITQNTLPNLLGNKYYMYQHLEDDMIYSAQYAKSFYFEVDNIATIVIEEEIQPNVWYALLTLTNTTKSLYNIFKGNIPYINYGDAIRIRFTGPYVYNFRYPCLYKYNFPIDTDVPDYTPYIRYVLPADYYRFNKIITETDYKMYQQIQSFRWETRITLIIPNSIVGNIKFLYFKYPIQIDNNTLDSFELELDTEAQELVPFYVAQLLLKVQNPPISNIIFQEYQSKLANLRYNDNIMQSEMQNIYNY